MEFALLPSVFLHLPITLLCLWLRLVVLQFPILPFPFVLCVGAAFSQLLLCCIRRSKLSLLPILNFCSILISYRYEAPNKEMFISSISIWMYMCRAPRYFRTRSHSKYLIPNLVCKVWKVFLNSDIVWSLSQWSVVHLVYWSL
jgi:hypothetical protein